MASRCSLPQHVVPQLFGFGAHGRQRGELLSEDFVCMGAFMFFKRAPIGDDHIMVVGGFGYREGALVQDEAGKLEHLPGDKSAFVAAVSIFDDIAHLGQRQFHFIKCHVGLDDERIARRERRAALAGDEEERVIERSDPSHDTERLAIELGDPEPEELERAIARQTIEVAPLAYMRGRTLSNAFVILDEAQNTTSEQMFMLLTRIGLNSKCVVTGDVTQIDLPANKRSGVVEAPPAWPIASSSAETHEVMSPTTGAAMATLLSISLGSISI